MSPAESFIAMAERVVRYRQRALTLRRLGRIDGLAPGADANRLADINDDIADRLDELYFSLR